jgi:hypothetical protein
LVSGLQTRPDKDSVDGAAAPPTLSLARPRAFEPFFSLAFLILIPILIFGRRAALLDFINRRNRASGVVKQNQRCTWHIDASFLLLHVAETGFPSRCHAGRAHPSTKSARALYVRPCFGR